MRFALALFLTTLSFSASAVTNFVYTFDGNLNKAESRLVKKQIIALTLKQYESSEVVVEAAYSCTTTPMRKVFCAVSLVSETGILGAASLTVNREDNTVTTTAHEID